MSAGNRWLLSIVATAAAILAYVIILIDRLAAGSRVDPRIHSAILATLTISAILTGGALILWRALAPVWAKLTEVADALAEFRAQIDRHILDRRAGRDEDTRDLTRPRGVATIVAVVPGPRRRGEQQSIDGAVVTLPEPEAQFLAEAADYYELGRQAGLASRDEDPPPMR